MDSVRIAPKAEQRPKPASKLIGSHIPQICGYERAPPRAM
jgi:hypothetical protein